MASSLDDGLSVIAAAIDLSITAVDAVIQLRRENRDQSMDLLIENERIATLRSIDEMELVLTRCERRMVESQEADLHTSFSKTVPDSPSVLSFRGYRWKQIGKAINELSDDISSETDDVVALLRRQARTKGMKSGAMQNAARRQELRTRLLHCDSVKEVLDILRTELARERDALK